MLAPIDRKRQPTRVWIIAAIVATILFLGAVASNLIASYLQPSLEPYKPWVWVTFGVALIVTIVVAIREARRASQSASSSAKPQTDSGDVVARDKIVHIYGASEAAVKPLHQLPPPVSDFTGRADELTELTKKLEQGGINITGFRGSGGIGKTALALKLADQLKARYSDAQFFLDLKGTSSKPLTAAEAMAHVIRSYHPTANLPDTEAELRGLYQSVLQNQSALLLMDNAASAEQVQPLIPPAGCVLLVTSRQHFTLPGLFGKNLEALSPEDAHELLLVIAPRIGDHAEEIARLCGYLPLALRLAGSALVKHANLKPEDYARRLHDGQRRLELIEASLNLSYELLSQELQKWWRLLAVFPDTFEEIAAAAVWDLEVDRAQDLLGELISASMVEWNESARRYRLHDLARLFIDARLSAQERVAGRRLHAVHYQTVLAAAENLYLKGGEAIRQGLALFDLEWRNIDAGQAWAEVEAGRNDQAAQLCIAYPEAGAYVLNLRQHPRAWIRWLEVAVDAARRLKRRASESSALGNLGTAYAGLGDTRRAIEFHEQALLIDREMGDRRGEGTDLGNLGIAYANLGETRRAIEFYEQRLDIAREIDDRRGEGAALGNLGLAYATLGETRRAIELFEQRLDIAREMGDRRGEGNALGNLGLAYASLGETKQAIEFYEQQLVIVREIGDRRGEGNGLGNLGLAYASLGETKQAIEFYERQLVIVREIGDRRGEGNALFSQSLALDMLGDRVRAIACAQRALTILDQIEEPRAVQVRAQLAEWQATQD